MDGCFRLAVTPAEACYGPSSGTVRPMNIRTVCFSPWRVVLAGMWGVLLVFGWAGVGLRAQTAGGTLEPDTLIVRYGDEVVGNTARSVFLGGQAVYALTDKAVLVASCDDMHWRVLARHEGEFAEIMAGRDGAVWMRGPTKIARVTPDGRIEVLETWDGPGSAQIQAALPLGDTRESLLYFVGEEARCLVAKPEGGWERRILGRFAGVAPSQLIERDGRIWAGTVQGVAAQFEWSGDARMQLSEVKRRIPASAGQASLARMQVVDNQLVQHSMVGVVTVEPEWAPYRPLAWLGTLQVAAVAPATAPREDSFWVARSGTSLLRGGPPALLRDSYPHDQSAVPLVLSQLDRLGPIIAAARGGGPDGFLWVFGRSAVLRVPINQLVADDMNLAVTLRAVVVDREVKPEFHSASATQTRFTLPPGAEVVEFLFGFSRASRERFTYTQSWLKGRESDWGPALFDRSRSYQNLRPGDYVLHVRAIDTLGRHGPELVVGFAMPEPWYWRGPGLVVLSLGALVLIVAVFWFRNAHLRRQNQRLNRLVSERTRELEMVSSAKSEFLATIGHEVRNPLNGVTGLVDQLRREPLGPQAEELAASLQDCSRTLTQVFDQVLDYTRNEHRPPAPRREAFGLQAVLREIMTEQSWAAARNQVELRLEWPEDLVDGFLGDPAKIKTIIGNFVSNAIKYAPGAPVAIGVEGSVTADGAVELFIEVRDQGPGLPAAEQELVFGKFVRGAQAKDGGVAGLGLGLAIARALAREMGGHVGLESELGKGTAFFLRLELAPAPAEVQSTALLSGRVLVIDDEHYNQAVLVGLLKDLGFIPVCVATALEARAAFSQTAFAAVLVDWELPDGKGDGVVEWIRRQDGGRAPRVIVVTGHDSDEVRRRCQEAGADGFLLKPVARDRLLRLLAVPRGTDAPTRRADVAGEESLNLRAFDLYAAGADRPVGEARGRYSQNLREEVAALRRRQEARDREGLAMHAHRLRSLAGLILARELSELSSRLEAVARSPAEDVWPQVEALVGEVATAAERLKSRLESASPNRA